MLPKKFIGRFTKIDETNNELVYGDRKAATNVDGIEFLKEGENVAMERILTDKDLKKIKLSKLREAVKRVDKKGFASESSSSEEVDQEEGEEEMS